LNSTFSEQRPTIRHDGLEIVFYSNRPGGVGSTDLWVATRESVDHAWNPPENLGPDVNSSATDFHASISSDGETLYFASERPGGPGLADLYVTVRTKVQGW
jgi:Tol biopolymer transport system component